MLLEIVLFLLFQNSLSVHLLRSPQAAHRASTLSFLEPGLLIALSSDSSVAFTLNVSDPTSTHVRPISIPEGTGIGSFSHLTALSSSISAHSSSSNSMRVWASFLADSLPDRKIKALRAFDLSENSLEATNRSVGFGNVSALAGLSVVEEFVAGGGVKVLGLNESHLILFCPAKGDTVVCGARLGKWDADSAIYAVDARRLNETYFEAIIVLGQHSNAQRDSFETNEFRSLWTQYYMFRTDPPNFAEILYREFDLATTSETGVPLDVAISPRTSTIGVELEPLRFAILVRSDHLESAWGLNLRHYEISVPTSSIDELCPEFDDGKVTLQRWACDEDSVDLGIDYEVWLYAACGGIGLCGFILAAVGCSACVYRICRLCAKRREKKLHPDPDGNSGAERLRRIQSVVFSRPQSLTGNEGDLDEGEDEFHRLMRRRREMNQRECPQIVVNEGLFEIRYEDIRFASPAVRLGSGGGGGIVFKGTWNGRTIALYVVVPFVDSFISKVFTTAKLCSDQNDFDEFEREVSVMANIVQFFGACLHPPRVGIVMEYCAGGDLSHYIPNYQARHGGHLPLQRKLRMLYQIASAMYYLHSRNIIHRDLKTENVLMTASDEAKIMDFGLSTVVERIECTMSLRVGTSVYMAPEVVRTRDYSEKCDVYSFGIIAWEIIHENFEPYGRANFNVELRVSSDSSFRPQIDEEDAIFASCGGEMLPALMQRCWNADPASRPSFKALLRELQMIQVQVVSPDEEADLRELDLEQPTSIDRYLRTRLPSIDRPVSSPPNSPRRVSRSSFVGSSVGSPRVSISSTHSSTESYSTAHSPRVTPRVSMVHSPRLRDLSPSSSTFTRRARTRMGDYSPPQASPRYTPRGLVIPAHSTMSRFSLQHGDHVSDVYSVASLDSDDEDEPRFSTSNVDLTRSSSLVCVNVSLQLPKNLVDSFVDELVEVVPQAGQSQGESSIVVEIDDKEGRYVRESRERSGSSATYSSTQFYPSSDSDTSDDDEDDVDIESIDCSTAEDFSDDENALSEGEEGRRTDLRLEWADRVKSLDRQSILQTL